VLIIIVIALVYIAACHNLRMERSWQYHSSRPLKYPSFILFKFHECFLQ